MEKDKKKKNNASDNLNLKEVHKVWGPAEAEVVRGFLESYGISCVFRGLAAQTVHPFSADGLGEIKICVPIKDYPLAKKLIEKIEK